MCLSEILWRLSQGKIVIDSDDKGVHIVAAINLYEASPETPLLGIKVCRELAMKRVGASVGMAIGPSFCGVTGSSEACRWDITGPGMSHPHLLLFALQTMSIDPFFLFLPSPGRDNVQLLCAQPV
jgi:hypothetical protein